MHAHIVMLRFKEPCPCMHAVVVMQSRCGTQQGLKEVGCKTIAKLCFRKCAFFYSSSMFSSMFLAVT